MEIVNSTNCRISYCRNLQTNKTPSKNFEYQSSSRDRKFNCKRRIIRNRLKRRNESTVKREKEKKGDGRRMKREKEEKLLISSRDAKRTSYEEEEKRFNRCQTNWDLARTGLAGLWPRMWVTVSCGNARQPCLLPLPLSKDLTIRFITMEILARGEAFRKDFLACSLLRVDLLARDYQRWPALRNGYSIHPVLKIFRSLERKEKRVSTVSVMEFCSTILRGAFRYSRIQR